MDVYEILFNVAEALLPYTWYVLFTMAVLIAVLVIAIRNIIYLGNMKKCLKIYINKNYDYYTKI